MNNQGMLYIESKNGKVFNNIYKKIISRDNIVEAFKELRTNSGSSTAGVDKLSIKDLEHLEMDEIISLVRNKLNNYRPQPVRRVYIPKQNGKLRPLGIPCIKDRLIQMCILRVLEPICEGKFNERSYGFRKDRSCHDAIARSRMIIPLGQNHYTVDIDIERFFDNVNHTILMRKIWSIGIRDKKVLSIIKKILKSKIEGVGTTDKGIPQGGIISPLLANIYLNDLDTWITSQWERFPARYKYSCDEKRYRAQRRSSNLKELWYVRYADDFRIYCKDKITARKIQFAVTDWLNKNLKLKVSEEKTKVVNLRKRSSEFLGFKFKMMKDKSKNGKLSLDVRISDDNLKRIQESYIKRVKHLLYEPREMRIFMLNKFILGVHNYYKIARLIGHDLIKTYLIGLRKMRRFVKSGVLERQQVIKDKTYKKRFGKYKFGAFGYKDSVIYQIAGVTGTLSKPRKDNINPYLSEKIVPVKFFSGAGSGQFYSHRIGKYYQQKGKCYVTGEELIKGECHHKIPRFKGGNDEYENLVLINQSIHIALHQKKTSLELGLSGKTKKRYDELLKLIV